MTVAELIAALQQMPPDAVVAVDDRDMENGVGWYEASDVSLHTDTCLHTGSPGWGYASHANAVLIR